MLMTMEQFIPFVSQCYVDGQVHAKEHFAKGGLCGCSISVVCDICIENGFTTPGPRTKDSTV